jgi:hypothetical protein
MKIETNGGRELRSVNWMGPTGWESAGFTIDASEVTYSFYIGRYKDLIRNTAITAVKFTSLQRWFEQSGLEMSQHIVASIWGGRVGRSDVFSLLAHLRLFGKKKSVRQGVLPT